MLFNTAQLFKLENTMKILITATYLTLFMVFSLPAHSEIGASCPAEPDKYLVASRSGSSPNYQYSCSGGGQSPIPPDATRTSITVSSNFPSACRGNQVHATKTTPQGTLLLWHGAPLTYSCPENSTLAGSTCTANDGFQSITNGSSCTFEPDEDDCPEGQSKDITGTCKPPKTDDDCKPAGKDQYYGTEINLPYAVVDLCFNGCQYRDALRDFVDGSCSDATNPFYSAFQPVPPATTSPPCAHTHASAQGVYVYTIGTRTGSACTTNENGGNADDGTNEPPPPFNPDDPDGDGEENPNDGDPPECNAVSGECSDSETTSSFTCNADGTISNFTCTGEASVCSTHQQSAETSCEELKESNCNPLTQICSPQAGDGSFSDLDPDIQTSKQDLQDYFDQVKNAIKSKFSFNTNVNGQLPCESVDLGVLGQFTLCVSDYADELEQVGQMILAIGFLLSIFIILG